MIIKYTRCTVAVDPRGDAYFIRHDGEVFSQSKTNEDWEKIEEPQDIEELLDYDYLLGNGDLEKGNVYTCDIIARFSSNFNGESTEYDVDIHVENGIKIISNVDES